MRIAVATALAAMFAAAAFADPPAPPAAPDPALADYPKAALAAGVEGEATLRCARNTHLALTNCTLVSETPPGQGFGAAALAMAARSPDNPKLNVAAAALTAAAPITVRFSLHPPSIDPDLTEMAHVLKPPKIAYLPSNEIMARYWPDRDLRAGISGTGRIHCRVTLKGRLTDCAVLEETPEGQDFGPAARLVAMREYRMTPQLYDGQPSDDGEADLTVEFAARPAARSAGAAAADPSLIKRPDWAREPDGDDYGRIYPDRAISHGVTLANTVMDCQVRADGRLDPCTIKSEAPPGYGFGAAALRIAVYFKMKPTDRDGAPTAGRHVLIPVHFQGPGG
jgi:TonB family protein